MISPALITTAVEHLFAPHNARIQAARIDYATRMAAIDRNERRRAREAAKKVAS